MKEHILISYAATIETMESLLAKFETFLKMRERILEENTPDKCASDQSRDYIMRRAYNEGALDVAREIVGAIRDELEMERQCYREDCAGYDEDEDEDE